MTPGPKPSFESIVSQLLMAGLVARYGDRDPEGLEWARQALRKELAQKGWVLPPFRLEGEDE